MQEIRPGIWHWEARHPDWTEAAGGWGPEVSSYAIDDGERLLFFDPLGVPAQLETLAAGRETAIVLTCPWHRRDAVALAERLRAPLHVPPPDEGDTDPVPGLVFGAGARLPVGVEAFPGMEPNDLPLWVESSRALVVGDSLIDRGEGLEFPRDWASRGAIAAHGVPPDEILASLQPLLELPVELVLPTHGAPTDRAALERALA
jgi:glyoxylase-like metal-dependent hydrolase (beta-lactamase superfamily II)